VSPFIKQTAIPGIPDDTMTSCRARLEATAADERHMRRALELARLGVGRVSPNPLVGAVICKDGEVIGEGWHKAFGGPHAEVEALRSLADPALAKGATLYVTLEPCCHTGKTGPCTEAVLGAGIARVVAATFDPNPLVAGKGMERLEQAGVRAELGLLEHDAIRMNRGFLMAHSQKRPFIVAKWAMTLDGRIAATSGDSQWVSNDTSLGVVHELRAEMDGIMVGIGTVMRDNPRLNVRLPGYTGKQPLRIVVDSSLRTPLKARLLADQGTTAGKTLLVCSETVAPDLLARYQQAGVDVLTIGDQHGMIDLRNLMPHLAERGVNNLLVEGGGQLHGSMMRQGLIDEVIAFIAPKLIGGQSAKNPIEGFGMEYMRDALRLTAINVCAYGTDLCIRGFVKKPNALHGLYDDRDDHKLDFERRGKKGSTQTL